MKLNKLLIIFLLINLCTTSIYSYTYLGGTTVGDYGWAYTTREIGMAGCGVAVSSGVNAINYNPSLLSRLNSRQLYFGMGYVTVNEKVVGLQQPIFFHEQDYYNFELISLVTKIFNRFVIGFSRVPFTDFRYYQEQAVYSSTQPVNPIGMNRLYNSGGIVKHSFAIATDIIPYLNFGFTADFYFGESYFETKQVVYFPFTQENQFVYLNYWGYSFTGGIDFMPIPDLRCGLVFNTSPEIKVKDKITNFENTIFYPLSWGIGIAQSKDKPYPYTLTVELRGRKWFYPNIINSPVLFKDTLEWRVGVEFIPSRVYTLRYGFTQVPYPGNSAYSTTYFTGGLGINLFDNHKLDIAYEFGKRNFIGAGQFYSSTQRIDETIQRVSISFTYNF